MSNREELLAAGKRAASSGQCTSVLVALDHTGEDNYHNCNGAYGGTHLLHSCGCGYDWTDRQEVCTRPGDIEAEVEFFSQVLSGSIERQQDEEYSHGQ